MVQVQAAPSFLDAMIYQLCGGGIGRLIAMLGADSITFDAEARNFKFRFKGSKVANCVEISLTLDDDYTMTFWKIPGSKGLASGKQPVQVKQFDRIYGDNLKEVFESFTGLYTSL